ncbi:MAG: FAD-dependent thymidylate synthase [Polyangiaceae bacterium]|nr:FAD-dependent thymidylate synthase [Polyangiaceae bacterium]
MPVFLDEASRAKIEPYVSSLTDDVFALTGLPEEVIAVLFAYYSRSRDDLRTNLARLLSDQELDVAGTAGVRPALRLATEKARSFHEKWVVGYGHASVAEHAAIHLAVENVSIIASKAIEDLRLGSYTEKSTRYVVFDQQSFVDLPELGPELSAHYRASAQKLFATYIDLLPKVMDKLKAHMPRQEGMAEGAYNAALRAQACDMLRGLLPAGARTNLGITANARALELLLSKLLSSPLAEVRSVGERMHNAALHVTPTLVKYAAPSEHRRRIGDRVQEAIRTVYSPPSEGANATMVIHQPVRLVRHDKDALERIALALAYEGAESGVHAYGLADAFRHATGAELEGIVKASVMDRGPHDPAPRAFEAATMTFELMLDYGAYRDLQRHRMLTPATQRLTCRLGFETPQELGELGFAEPYQDALLAAREVWEKIDAANPLEAQYAVPLGYRIRTMWTLNLRELFHVIELRSARQGHTSYRRIAQGLYRTAVAVHPWLKDLIRVDLNDYAMARA